MQKPKRLQPGDTIGIVSPSSRTTEKHINRMISYFEEKDYSVTVAPNALASFSFMAGTVKKRADDFNLMLRDPSVRMVMTSMGGAGALHLLPFIDYDALSSDPKIVVGLSDLVVILNALTCKTGVPTFHGPNGVEFGGGVPLVDIPVLLTRFTEENFWPIISENICIPYTFPVSHAKVLREGKAEGRLFGGNLKTLQTLIGTPWEPEWENCILFIEEFKNEIQKTDAMLAHFRLAGVFDAINGLVVGQPAECGEGEEESREVVILRNCAEYDFPIIANIPLGHTDDKITLPIGCSVRLNTGDSSLELLESPTCER